MRHGVYGEVFPDRRCGGFGAPVKGEVHRGEALGVVPRGVLGSEDREGGEGGGQAGGRRVMGGGGASYAQGSESPPVPAVDSDGRETCLARKYGGGRGIKTIGDPSARPVPEGVHRIEGVGVGGEEVRSIGEDGEEEACCDSVVEEGADPRPRGGESLDE